MAFLFKGDALVILGHRLKFDASAVALGVLLITTTVLNFTAFAGEGLSIDEVWTGMIAGQSSVVGLIRQCEIDVNAPLSYVIAWLWAPLGGLSDAALRLPSTLFACVTPFVALAPSRLIPRGARMIWAALLACWLPEFHYAQLARCYALVVLLATGNTVAFAQLMKRPSLRAAVLWSLLSALLILDHYFSVVLVGCQGVAYLALRHGRALRTWPAALLFIPVIVEIALKFSLLSHFAKPGVSWITRITWADLAEVVAFLAGTPFLAGAIGVGLSVGWFLHRRGASAFYRPSAGDGADGPMIAALVASLGVVITVALAFVFPILSPRYLTIEAPGVLLGVALLTARFTPAWPFLPLWLMASAVSVVLSLSWYAAFIRQPAATAFGFERAAKALMADNPRRLIFFRDNPSAQGEDLDQLSQVGGFFFKRAGRPIPVDAVPWVRGDDANAVLLSKADAPGIDILWQFDRDVGGTLALAHPPDISRRDPRWTCRDFGAGNIRFLACHQGGPLGA